MIPTVNKTTRVARQSATAIDHILTNCFVNFDHFPISFFLPMTIEFSKTEPIYIHKRIIMIIMQLRYFVKSYTKLTGQKLKHQEIQMFVIKSF